MGNRIRWGSKPGSGRGWTIFEEVLAGKKSKRRMGRFRGSPPRWMIPHRPASTQEGAATTGRRVSRSVETGLHSPPRTATKEAAMPEDPTCTGVCRRHPCPECVEGEARGSRMPDHMASVDTTFLDAITDPAPEDIQEKEEG